MNTKLQWVGIVVAIAIAALGTFASGGEPKLGDKTADFWDAASYKVSGTEVISSSRGLSGSTGAFSSTVGVSSTTPFTTLGIGTSGTSTIAGQKFCAYFVDEAGRSMWIKLAISGNVVFSTSTTPCN